MMDRNIQGLTIGKAEGVTLEFKPANIGLTPFEKLATSGIFYGIDFKKEDIGVLDKIDRYIINENATIIFWKDGNKTISKVDTEDVFNKEIGFMLAVYKYLALFATDPIWSKTEIKKSLDCIKTDRLYDFLFITFNKFTFKDTNKSKRYLSELKIEKGKKKAKRNTNSHKINTIDNLTILEEKLNLEQKKDIEILEETCKKIKEENKETKKIFSKEKFIEAEGEKAYLGTSRGWVDKCDGEEVINGRINCYTIQDAWCEVK